MKSLIKSAGRLLLAALFAVLVLPPKPVLAKKMESIYLKARFPMKGDTYLELYNPAGLDTGYQYMGVYSSGITYTVYRDTTSTSLGTKIGELRDNHTGSINAVKINLNEELGTLPHVYTLQAELKLNVAHDSYERPSTTGWGISFGPLGALSDFGYTRKISAANVTVKEVTETGSGKSYLLTFNVSFCVLNPIHSISLDASSGLELSHGDAADYDFISNYSTWYKVDASSPIEWYPQTGGDNVDPVYSEDPISKDTKLVGGQYYKVKVPVSFGTGSDDYGVYCGLYSKTSLTASALDWAAVANGGYRYQWCDLDVPGREDKYDQNTHIYTVVFDRVLVVRPIETLNITGITAPQIGKKPVTSGLNFTSPDVNSLTPYSLSESWTDDKNTKKGVWSGTFDSAGGFIPGNHYILTVACGMDQLDYDLYTFEGFKKDKIKTNAGTVESVAKDSRDISTIKIGFDCPTISISSASVSVPDQTYTGSALTPAPAVKLGSTTLKAGTDYTVSYSGNVNAGTAKYTVTGKGKYGGTVSGTFKINPRSLSGASITVADQTYTGKALTPALTVKLGNVTLKAGTDYTASYANNTNIGTATVTITGKGNYNDTVKGKFTISKKAGENATVTPAADDTTTDPAKQMGKDGTALGKGASLEAAEAAITRMNTDEAPAGSVFNLLKLKSTRQTKTSVTISWSAVSGAKKYVVYGNKCGRSNKMKKLKTTVKKSFTFRKVAGKKVRKGTYYKFLVVALDANNKVVTTSKTIHVATKGGNVGNDKKVTTAAAKKKNKISIVKGKTFKLKAKAVVQSKKLKVRRHRKIAYESSNTKIAIVSKNGVIKGVKKGTCFVYAYAQNGICAKIRVTVKAK